MKAIAIRTLALATVLLSCFSCSPPKDEPETLVKEYDESTMDEAIATAKGRVDEFLQVLASGEADSFSVKAPITDPNGTEHFWLTDVTFAGGKFKGLVGNDPGIVKNVKYGESWSVDKDEISDWMFTRGDKIHGGFTIDPLLDSYPKEEADALRANLVR